MNEELLNILTNEQGDIDDQKLIDYVNGKLSGEENHAIEKWMADHHIASDAVEGLLHVREKKNLLKHVEQLNKNLQEQLKQRKAHRFQKKLREYPWIYATIVLVLLFGLIAYVIVARLLHYF
jgi:anti-sigma factor RsiW